MMDGARAGIVASVGVWAAAIAMAAGGHFWIGAAVWGASLAILVKCCDMRAKARRAERMAALVRFGAQGMDGMTGVQFERMLAAVFAALGYGVTATPASGDYGTDLVMARGGRRIAVQAKRVSKSVGNKAVQEALAGMLHYGAHEAWVVTNRSFTRGAVRQAESSGVILVDRDGLIGYIQSASGLPGSGGMSGAIGGTPGVYGRPAT